MKQYDELAQNSNSTIAKAYEHTQEAGNERLNIDDIIWDKEIPEIAKMVKMLGLREFTISVCQGNLIDVLAAFQELGVFMDGTVQVKKRWDPSIHTSAILMETL